MRENMKDWKKILNISEKYIEYSLKNPSNNIPVQSRNISTSGNEGRVAIVVNDFQRTLNTIENIGHDTRTQFDRKRRVCAQDGITDGQTG